MEMELEDVEKFRLIEFIPENHASICECCQNKELVVRLYCILNGSICLQEPNVLI